MKLKIRCNVNEGIVRLSLIACNFIFAVLSIALITLGVVYIEGLWWPSDFASLNFIRLPVLLIILGALSFLSSLAGCYCSRTSNRRYLIAFVVFLVILLALELTIAFIAFSNVSAEMENNTKAILAEEFVEETKSQRKKFHAFETYYDCCGVNSVLDYQSLLQTTLCCQNVCRGDLLETTDAGSKLGCADMLNSTIERASLESGGFILVFIVLQVFQMCCLFSIIMQDE